MITYKVAAHPDLRLAAHGLTDPRLSTQALVEKLADATLHQLIDIPWGQEFELALPGSSPDALNRIDGTLQELGFSLLEATVREWSSEVLVRAMLGVGGGVAAGGISENLLVGLVCSVAGAAIGAWSGARARQLVAEYSARRDYRGTWTFHKIQEQQQATGHDFPPVQLPAQA